MPGTCDYCGEQVVEREATFGGKYVGACRECREGFDLDPPHVETCDDEECIVCEDYHEEFGEVGL